MPRIGLFGGSFDPVHLGHLLVAQAALEELNLSRLILIPAAQSPFKPDRQPGPAAARMAMLRLALAGESRCEVDDLELKRGGISYTVDTVRTFASRFPGSALFCLVGADHVATLPLWREAEDLARLTEFVVVPRPGEALALPPTPFRVTPLRGTPLALSSSQLRARIQAGRPIRHLVPAPVEDFIRQNKLYL